MNRIQTFLKSSPFYLFLLPVFFVFHGYVENYEIGMEKDAATLLLIYTGASFGIAFISWLFYKNIRKAFLVAFCLMAFNFFFGSAHDYLKAHFEGSFIVKYIFILPATFIFFLSLFIWIKKTNRTFTRTTAYLNWVLLLLIIVDAVDLGNKIISPRQNLSVHSPISFTICDTCSRPDIYLIIADEYAGHQELQDIFHYDITPFENQLRNRGFRVLKNTKSNYNATVYSMASMLNMGYIENITNLITVDDVFSCQNLIKENEVVKYFSKLGYEIKSHSFLEFGDKTNEIIDPLFITKKSLLISQTFITRFLQDLGYHFATDKEIETAKRTPHTNNIQLQNSTIGTTLYKTIHPKFVYTHLGMPHHPYFLDSTGKEVSYKTFNEAYAMNKNAYLEYLVYTNHILLNLVDNIKAFSKNPPIILLMSDHGFRQFPVNIDQQYHFMNLNTIYLPKKNYSKFYDGMSNVNQFRILLNTAFGENLPILKDSTSFLWYEHQQEKGFGH